MAPTPGALAKVCFLVALSPRPAAFLLIEIDAVTPFMGAQQNLVNVTIDADIHINPGGTLGLAASMRGHTIRLDSGTATLQRTLLTIGPPLSDATIILN